MSETRTIDRVKELGEHDGPRDAVSVIRDVFRVMATLIQSDEYCWCQSFPCECVMTLFDDMTDCLEVRYPELKAARIAEMGA